jgi:hypothetical protein
MIKKVGSLKNIKHNSLQKVADMPGCIVETTFSGTQYLRMPNGSMRRLDDKRKKED